MSEYDCTNDVMLHRKEVMFVMSLFSDELEFRALAHDLSKLNDPLEKETFDRWSPELRNLKFGSDAYKQALDEMGPGVQRHYENNRHHPEHFEHGVNDMTLPDLVEMFCDWAAVARAKGVDLDLGHAQKRFGLSDQLTSILHNTWKLLQENHP